MKKSNIFISTLSLIALSCAVPSTRSETHKFPMNDQSGKTENPYYSVIDTAHLNVADEEWKRVLPDSVYKVARGKATEYAFTGKYWDFFGLGVYRCAACGNALFRSDSKFGSSCGWPSFFETIRPGSALYVEDESHGMSRTEVLCGRCDAHLGHIFDDGPPPTYKRYCMNSIVLDFFPDNGNGPGK